MSAEKPPSPIRPTDDAARDMARELLAHARFGALGTIDPTTGAPKLARVAVGTDSNGNPVLLISDLATHTQALRADNRVSLMVGEPGPKGDPLTHPRLSIEARAMFCAKNTQDFADLREKFLADHPKSKLYIDFADFHLVKLIPQSAFLNGGFGKAFELSAEDLCPAEKGAR